MNEEEHYILNYYRGKLKKLLIATTILTILLLIWLVSTLPPETREAVTAVATAIIILGGLITLYISQHKPS